MARERWGDREVEVTRRKSGRIIHWHVISGGTKTRKRRVTSADRETDRKNGRKATGTTWSRGEGKKTHTHTHHRDEEITARDREIDRLNGLLARKGKSRRKERD